VVIDSGVPLSQQSGGVNHSSEPPPILVSSRRALQRLVSDAVPQDELPSLIETLVTNVKPADIANFLERRDEAQTFIDVMDQVRNAGTFQMNTKLITNLSFVRLWKPSISHRQFAADASNHCTRRVLDTSLLRDRCTLSYRRVQWVM
jgi:hypothetical protein